MAIPEEYQIAKIPITSHAFNADRSRQLSIVLDFLVLSIDQSYAELAVSLNSNDAQIMSRQGHEWKVTETLSEVCRYRIIESRGLIWYVQHDKLITAIDWAPNSNRIVTASQDKNAYVWQQTPDPQTGQTILETHSGFTPGSTGLLPMSKLEPAGGQIRSWQWGLEVKAPFFFSLNYADFNTGLLQFVHLILRTIGGYQDY